ncbi:hypothetical protein C450_04388 [Halococcus salifodinae DSM 8989]|uniref:Uncharacterized protein n=1 Tax=Halococcus salifodinae DSM 8989 TaxID=1227456 RepID=M0NDX1_9EURY|nr:hypothetical protein C450_04388 [Halococcus salifodinae DSM 8989]
MCRFLWLSQLVRMFQWVLTCRLIQELMSRSRYQSQSRIQLLSPLKLPYQLLLWLRSAFELTW